jgi:hypothetical protein
MARLFHASFERIPPAQLQSLGLWASVGSGIVNTTGRNGLGVTGTAGATQAENTLRTVPFASVTPTKGYQGFALKCVTLPAAERKVWALLDNGGGVLVTVTVRPDGKVRTYRGTFESGTLLATSSAAFTAAGAFRYLQVGYDFGTDSLLVLSTNSSGPTPITSLLSSAPGLTSPLPWASSEFYLDELLVLDDYYVNDANATFGLGNNYFSGDTAIVTLAAAADRTPSPAYTYHLHPNTGSDTAAVTDDDPLDFDATYVYARDSFHYLLYQMDTLVDDGRTVDDVQIVAVSRAVSSSWSPGFGPLLSRWDGIILYTDRVPLTWTGYLGRARMLRGTGATGGNAWTVDRVNDTLFGVACV